MQHPIPDPRGNRAQSETLGVALLLGIAIVGAVAVVATGFAVIDRDQAQVGTAQAERSLSQFDSRAGEVALGRSDSARIDVAVPDTEGTTAVRTDEGWIRIRLTGGPGGPPPRSNLTVADATLGSVVFQQGDRTVGYQSGGVFQSTGNRSVLVSRPELHYRKGTLTIPIIRIRGGTAAASVLQVSAGGTVRAFPDPERDPSLTNKVDDRTVTVTVKSRYYEAWGRYFDNQFPGDVTVDEASQTVTATFEPDSELEFMHVTIHQIDVSSG